jgi:hypothetical protein
MTRRTCLALAAAWWLTLMLFAAPPHVHAGSPAPAGDKDARRVALQNSQVITGTQPVTPTVTGQTTESEGTSQEEQGTVPPSDLTQALGVLGLFAAVMAVLAVGTEVIVDTIKLAIGMKSKPTAMASMEKLEALLPGKLKDFGASADAQKQVEGYLKGLRVVMEDVQTIQESILDLRKGQVLDALRKLHDLAPEQFKEQLKQSSEAAADYALGFLSQHGVELTQDENDHIRRLINDMVTDLSTDNAEALKTDLEIRLDRLIEKVHTMADTVWEYEALIDSVQSMINSWLNEEENKKLLAEGGANALIQKAEETLLAQLRLPPELRQQVSVWLKSTISGLDTTAQNDLDNYLQSLTNLLKQVRDEREEIHSPARKFWRHLVRIEFLGIGRLFKFIQRIWDQFFGHPPQEPIPTLTLTDTAAVIMQEETRQRDEEASRLRWMRLISVVAGIWLASSLGINAGELLKDVFPGLVGPLNDKVVEVVARINFSTLGDLIGALWSLIAAVPLLGSLLNETLLPYVKEIQVGVILSGLGAAAGSAFWHDQLEKLQSAKKASEQLDRLRAQLSEMQSSGGQ